MNKISTLIELSITQLLSINEKVQQLFEDSFTENDTKNHITSDKTKNLILSEIEHLINNELRQVNAPEDIIQKIKHKSIHFNLNKYYKLSIKVTK